MEPGIQLKESGIHPRLESRTKVPLSRNPKCGTWNLETMAWNQQKPRLLPLINTWGDTLEERSEPPPLHAALAVHPVIFLFPQTNPSVPGYIDKHIFFQLAFSRNAVLNVFFTSLD